ncbi:MAG: hypothetical protein Q7R30_04970 [Acidobacteriota bacterium]|nr:hypothetical protein [Acidobacteriota bacterium]
MPRHPRAVFARLEDLQWIDKPSEEFFETLIADLAGARVLLVATYRPGYRAPWMDRSYATQITLRPLSAADSLAVLSSAMDIADMPQSFSSAVLSRAEGNPFFLEELARAILDHDSMDRLIPDSIQGVIMAHLHRCPDTVERDRRILDVALRHAHSLYFLGRFRESVNLLLQHESRLARVDDATISGRYFSWLGHMYARLGDPNAAAQSAERPRDESNPERLQIRVEVS